VTTVAWLPLRDHTKYNACSDHFLAATQQTDTGRRAAGIYN